MRQWRKAVPYLAAKPGKSARFTFADLVGLCAVAEIVNVYRAHIKEIGSGVDSLFQKLADARPPHLEGLIAIIRPEEATLLQLNDVHHKLFLRSSLVVPCDPLILRMRAQMLPFAPASEQAVLPFPPQALKASR
jgi:hypothetical protein